MSDAEAAAGRSAFKQLLVNTFVANVTTSFLWFSFTFWIYLQTRNVMATAFLGGGYLLMLALMAVPFGGLVDRWPKKRVMVAAQLVTAVTFGLALIIFLAFPQEDFSDIGSPGFWILGGIVLTGAVIESARGIALATTITLLIPQSGRDRANGFMGMVHGMSAAATSVLAGVVVGQLGMGAAFVIAMVLTALALVHVAGVEIPEPAIVHAEGVPRAVDLKAAFEVVRQVPSLGWMIFFATFNNLLGGVFVALMDPYGLTLVPVETWGFIWGAVSFGFILGSLWVTRVGLGRKPLRVMMQTNLLMWGISMLFTLRENIGLTIAGLLLWIAITPVSEAAEHTVLQRLVPYPKQGRVFGLIQAAEVAASPFSAFLVGPLAQYVLIPYMASDAGKASWGWLLGDGQARGIAAVFVLASIVGLIMTAVAMSSRPYRTLSAVYAAGSLPSVEPDRGTPQLTTSLA